MKLPNTSIIVVISLCLLTSYAYADLDSSTYAKAREEYTKGNYYEALPLLKRYKSEDDKFLEDNPKVLSAINDAIGHCENVLFPSLPGLTFPLAPPQKPDLPVNLAHAFETEARLRAVIAELKSGSPNYNQMEPMLRIAIRRQMAGWATRLQALGSLQSISFEGKQQDADVYEVKFTNGSTAWMIGIAPNGNIATLNFQ